MIEKKPGKHCTKRLNNALADRDDASFFAWRQRIVKQAADRLKKSGQQSDLNEFEPDARHEGI
ncbi:MAG: hypothetical protein ACD_39C00392G0003 [uncultured bacterium]|nr:MAG: hypothetical protein ACD_39C00392G0003 [uncultured bacterium]